MHRRRYGSENPQPPAPWAIDRRRFLKAALGAGVVSCGAGLGIATAAAQENQPATATGDPKMQYRHPYHQTLVYKAFLASKPDRVHMTLDETLEAIRRLHAATAGIPQIVYLVGWQFDGHDSKYPAWSEVNHRLKRPSDADARESLLWLMREARQYNAVVSLHINMINAYENSPLWTEYLEEDLLIRDADGELVSGGVWGGEQSYTISIKREWDSGFAKKRIDALLAFLPIADAGTVHVDVFSPAASPYHGETREDGIEGMRTVARYWREKGVDVTAEDFVYGLEGLTPMVWHYNVDERGRLMFPPDVLCGGGSMWSARLADFKPDPSPQFNRPQGGCLYPEAWGESIDGDLASLGTVPVFALMYYKKTVPWQFLNQFKPLRHEMTATDYRVFFEDGVETCVRHAGRAFTLRHGDRVHVDGGDLCVPLAWRKPELIAFSAGGARRRWSLCEGWAGVSKAELTSLWPPDADDAARVVPVEDGTVDLDLAPEHAVLVTPA